MKLIKRIIIVSILTLIVGIGALIRSDNKPVVIVAHQPFKEFYVPQIDSSLYWEELVDSSYLYDYE